jgi:transcription elongation GreA/GreB family factor
MRETAAAELRPRFRTLSKEEIRFKRPGDVVTCRTPRGEEELEVVSVTYGAPDRDEPKA